MRWGMQHFQRACQGHVGYFKQDVGRKGLDEFIEISTKK
jgi:hypothetical protein